jgi:hypothetical protein
VVLYGFETCSLTLWKEHLLRVTKIKFGSQLLNVPPQILLNLVVTLWVYLEMKHVNRWVDRCDLPIIHTLYRHYLKNT